MAAPDERPQIIGNESNTVTEIETGGEAQTREPNTTAEKKEASEQSAANSPTAAAERSNNEVATDDGAVIETLDTAFHNKPGVAEGSNPSGSNRAGYYESRSYGKTDAEEELDALNDKHP